MPEAEAHALRWGDSTHTDEESLSKGSDGDKDCLGVWQTDTIRKNKNGN